MPLAHRSGPLKQTNKLHRSKHRSKRTLNANGLKVKPTGSIRKKRNRLTKKTRRVQNNQKRKLKQLGISCQRKSSALSGVPIVLSIIGISNRTTSDSFLDYFRELGVAFSDVSHASLYNFKLKGIKCQFQLLTPDAELPLACIDAAKVSASVLFICHANDAIEDINDSVVDLICQHCLPNCSLLIRGLKSESVKKRSQVIGGFSEFFKLRVPDCNIQSIDDIGELFSLLQQISTKKPVETSAKQGRSYIVGEECDLLENELSLTGYVRGNFISPDRLMYIAGIGPCQIKQIEVIDPVKKGQTNENRENNLFSKTILFPNSNDRILLPDNQQVPQSHQCDEDVFDDTQRNDYQTTVTNVPQGTSEYQAAWLQCVVDDEDELSEDDYLTNEEDDVSMITEENVERHVTFADDVMSVVSDECDDNIFKKDLDEIPMLQNARLALKKYRGIHRFRSTPWVDEELPSEYALLNQFENFKNAVKFIRKSDAKISNRIEVGCRVRIVFENITGLCKEKIGWSTVTAFSLFAHEEKISVCNILLNRSISSEQMLKSNQKLIFIAGIRRFTASAIFSEITNADKFKCEKQFTPGTTLMATVYAPIMLSPCPVVVLTKYIDGSMHLVASGHLVNCDPGRVILERIILKGKPYKINGKKAVVHGMFSNPEDIHHFKSIPVTSKYSRKGSITDSIGSRGFMKCKFDRPLKSQDVVRMNLYKRIFPIWDFTDLNDFVAKN